MKILYAIQGTGNGHLSRANDIVPMLERKGELDILISGLKAQRELPFPVRYWKKGLGFTFGKRGGVDILDTLKHAEVRHFWKEARSLPIENYDLLINDFEPVSAWAARFKDIPCISLSHQAAVLNKHAPRPKKPDPIGKGILKRYAPVDAAFGFHFARYDTHIFTPVIRHQIRTQEVSNKGHYTVYLPAYGEKKLIQRLSTFPKVRWEVFSKHTKSLLQTQNILIRPVDNEAFIQSMASSNGVLCGAGFETPAEALFLGKKLMVIPMKGQYEQKCNAASLKALGVPVIKNLKSKRLPVIKDWLDREERVKVDYPDETELVIDKLLGEYKKLRSIP